MLLLEIRAKLLCDPLFHRLTLWMADHIMTETFSHQDLLDAANIAAVVAREKLNDYGCMLNLLKDKDEE